MERDGQGSRKGEELRRIGKRDKRKRSEFLCD